MLRMCAALLALVAVGTAGCSHDASSSKGNGTAAPAPGCESTTAPAAAPSLMLCLSGALSGTLTAVDPETTQCTALQPGSFTGTFVATLGGVETRYEFQDARGSGSFDINAGSSDITLGITQAAVNKNWSSIAEAGRGGTVTIDPDRSGAVNVTLPERDYRTGAEVPGGPTLTVRGTFRCPVPVS